MSNSLIEVKDLKVYFKQKSPKLLSFKPGILKAVDQVSFSIGKNFRAGRRVRKWKVYHWKSDPPLS